jgi:hypothetical protein
MVRVSNKTAVALLLALSALTSLAQVDRVVILKIDGLPPRILAESRPPNIQHVFIENGTQLDNFYVRGLSLSAPSWSLLDTGRPLEIRGNVEYDRYSLRPYDYLNFVPLYFSAAAASRVDARGVELLDELHVPLLLDRFPVDQHQQAFQLLQRGVRWDTLKSSLKRFVSKNPRDALDEWIVGMSISESMNKQYEAELIQALQNPRIRYLDYFSGEYDHVAHLTHDPVSQRVAIDELDGFVGRLWSAIEKSPLADTTAVVLVSDHGMNTSEKIFSQGYSLVDWFGSAAGGGHHVLTNRHPLGEFKVRGLDPFVSSVVTPSAQSPYLANQSYPYPTVMLDLDGNERAGIGLRNNTLNILHIFLDQLTRKPLPPAVRAATLNAFFDTIDGVRGPWLRDIANLNIELAKLDLKIADLQKAVAAQPKKWTKEQIAQELQRVAHRQTRQLELYQEDRTNYSNYAAIITRLMDLTPADFDPGKFKLITVIPPRSLGPPNSVYDLQHYVTGPGPNGFVLTPDGRFDWERSFTRIDYFAALHEIAVRNNTQPGVGPRPIDFVAVDTAAGIWLYRDSEHQALIEKNGAQLRYRDVANLQGQKDGSVRFDVCPPAPGFPLNYFEDPDLAIPSGSSREQWLSDWHPEREWFEAIHRTRYSNGLIGLVEEMTEAAPAADALDERKRQLRRPDMIVFANDHWNFNARGFNPGGNHGSFLRESTHSVLMFAGGSKTGIPNGLHVATPYDSLSFVPTILTLMDRPEPDLRGPVINELMPSR